MAVQPQPPFTAQPGAPAPRAMRLETRRFVVRTVVPADANPRWLSWADDPEVMGPLNVATRKMSIGDLQRYIAGFDQATHCLFGIYDKASGDQVGFYMIDIDPHHRLANFNLVIGDRAWWGKDVVNETRAALLDHVFTKRGVDKAIGQPLARNFPAVFNYRAQGWRLEGIFKAHRTAQDGSGRLDQFAFGLTKDEWLALKRKGAGA
jgi:RimJ/RimL family protein N-acetyltransferase